MNLGLGGAEVLQQIEVRPPLLIERDDLPVEDGVIRQVFQGGGDVGEFAVEDVAAAREERGLALLLHRLKPKAVEFDLVAPILAFREDRHGQAFHGFDEANLRRRLSRFLLGGHGMIVPGQEAPRG